MKTVYIAECLKTRHPDVYLAMRAALERHKVPLVEVAGTGNIWIRDWAPIKNGPGRFIRFQPKADTEKYPFLKVEEDCMLATGFATSDLVLDGGNVVRSPDGSRVIMTETTLYDNIYRPGGKQQIAELLEAEIIWIQPEPGDDLGHADGIVQWIDDSTVFVNDYRSMRDMGFSCYAQALQQTLRLHHIEAVPFPYAYDECRELSEERFRQEFPDADDQNPAWGYYLNFLKVDDLVLYPIFHHPKDRQAKDCLLDAWPNGRFEAIDCSRLSMEGGLIHCVTWES